MSLFLLILLAMLIGDSLWLWSVWRTFRSNRCRTAFLTFGGIMAGGLIYLVVGRVLGFASDASMPRWLLIVIFLWHFLGLAAFLLLRFTQLTAKLNTILRFIHVGRSRPSGPKIPRVEVDLGRRAFFARAIVVAPVLATVAAGVRSASTSGNFRIRRLDVPIRGLPSAIDGLTIAHVSDTHLGRFTTSQTLQRIAVAVNDLDADLVLQTGDLINNDQDDLPAAAEFVRSIRARHGHFLCEGNHDLIGGRQSFERFMREAKLPILIDEIATVRVNDQAIDLVGLPWIRSQQGGPAAKSLDALIAENVRLLSNRRTAGAFPILLAHHPHAFDAAQACGIPLTLSGHTHGGQCNVIPGVNFGRLMYRYWSGLYERDGMAAVVSNGVGDWFPLRVNAPAEILHLTLRRG